MFLGDPLSQHKHWKMDTDWRRLSYWKWGFSVAILVYWRVHDPMFSHVVSEVPFSKRKGIWLNSWGDVFSQHAIDLMSIMWIFMVMSCILAYLGGCWKYITPKIRRLWFNSTKWFNKVDILRSFLQSWIGTSQNPEGGHIPKSTVCIFTSLFFGTKKTQKILAVACCTCFSLIIDVYPVMFGLVRESFLKCPWFRFRNYNNLPGMFCIIIGGLLVLGGSSQISKQFGWPPFITAIWKEFWKEFHKLGDLLTHIVGV